MPRTPEDSRRWMEEGTALFLRAVDGLSTDDYDAGSALPDWTRKNLVGHVAHNAEALRNLTRWAATGEESPMYSSTQQRNDDIAAAGARDAGDLHDFVHASADALASDMRALSDEAWNAEVVTAQGRTVPFTEVPWMRSREVMVHAVDLGTGVTFADLPSDFNAALVDDIVGKRSNAPAGSSPALRIATSDAGASQATWDLPGEGEPTAVTGTLAAVTAWLAGRSTDGVSTTDGSPLPTLPAWL